MRPMLAGHRHAHWSNRHSWGHWVSLRRTWLWKPLWRLKDPWLRDVDFDVTICIDVTLLVKQKMALKWPTSRQLQTECYLFNIVQFFLLLCKLVFFKQLVYTLYTVLYKCGLVRIFLAWDLFPTCTCILGKGTHNHRPSTTIDTFEKTLDSGTSKDGFYVTLCVDVTDDQRGGRWHLLVNDNSDAHDYGIGKDPWLRDIWECWHDVVC